MNEIVYWVFVAGAAGFVLQRLRASYVHRRRETVMRARKFACPATGKEVRCVLLRDARSGRSMEVLRCSAFDASTRPPCDQNCVRILNMGIPLRPSRTPKA